MGECGHHQRHPVETHWIGEPTVGIWCPDCLLPSRWSHFVVLTPLLNPAFTLTRGTYTRCESCGWSHYDSC